MTAPMEYRVNVGTPGREDWTTYDIESDSPMEAAGLALERACRMGCELQPETRTELPGGHIRVRGVKFSHRGKRRFKMIVTVLNPEAGK